MTSSLAVPRHWIPRGTTITIQPMMNLMIQTNQKKKFSNFLSLNISQNLLTNQPELCETDLKSSLRNILGSITTMNLTHLSLQFVAQTKPSGKQQSKKKSIQ
jgi:hypothetical protein